MGGIQLTQRADREQLVAVARGEEGDVRCAQARCVECVHVLRRAVLVRELEMGSEQLADVGRVRVVRPDQVRRHACDCRRRQAGYYGRRELLRQPGQLTGVSDSGRPTSDLERPPSSAAMAVSALAAAESGAESTIGMPVSPPAVSRGSIGTEPSNGTGTPSNADSDEATA